MIVPATKLLEQCLALPVEEREYLADKLRASVQGRDSEWESAWADEAARRSQGADQSGDVGRPWTEVKSALLTKLTSR